MGLPVHCDRISGSTDFSFRIENLPLSIIPLTILQIWGKGDTEAVFIHLNNTLFTPKNKEHKACVVKLTEETQILTWTRINATATETN